MTKPADPKIVRADEAMAGADDQAAALANLWQFCNEDLIPRFGAAAAITASLQLFFNLAVAADLSDRTAKRCLRDLTKTWTAKAKLTKLANMKTDGSA